MYTLTFVHCAAKKPYLTLKKVKAGQSLLEVAIDNAIPMQHDCGGICGCGTCHIILESGNEFVEFKSRREMHQLQKVAGATTRSRLACQCVLLPGKGNLFIVLPHLSKI
jgi:ferredoxin, 2Fe-2S